MTVAWIGLGNMGGRMATNLVRAGNEVVGYDIDDAARESARRDGLRIVKSVEEAVGGAETIFTMLPTGTHVRDVVQTVLRVADRGTLVIDSSTIETATALELHHELAAAGLRFLDAPVSGGTNGAGAATLTFMVGGAAEDLDRARPVIEPLSSCIFHTGGPGAGQSAKIVNNLMLGVNLAGLCEGATLARRLGLSAETIYDLVKASTGDSWALRTWYPQAGVVDSAPVNRDFEGGFSTDLFVKDLGLALQAAEETQTSLDHTSNVAHALQQISAAGYGSRDCTILVRKVDGSLVDSGAA